MEQIHLTPDMLINDDPSKPLSPFKPRKRGATAFWHTVRDQYPPGHGGTLLDDGTRKTFTKKTERDRAKDAVRAAFVRGWKTNCDGGILRMDRLAAKYATSKHAEPAHLIAAHVNGFDFYAEQFPIEEAA